MKKIMQGKIIMENENQNRGIPSIESQATRKVSAE
jgi:hypothetical protein